MTSKTTSAAEEGEISERSLKRRHSDDNSVIENYQNKHLHESMSVAEREERYRASIAAATGVSLLETSSEENSSPKEPQPSTSPWLEKRRWETNSAALHRHETGRRRISQLFDGLASLGKYRTPDGELIIGPLAIHRAAIAAEIRKSFDPKVPLTIDWDEKIMPDATGKEKKKVRSIDDFDPKQMNETEKRGFRAIVQRFTLNEIRRDRHRADRRNKQIFPDEEFKDFEKIVNLLTEAMFYILTTDKDDLQNATSYSEGRLGSKEINSSASNLDSYWAEVFRSHWVDSKESDVPEDQVCPYALALPFKRGDQMEAIPSEDISDKYGWWLARHLDNGELGFIPRNRIVMENDDQSSKTTKEGITSQKTSAAEDEETSVSIVKRRHSDETEIIETWQNWLRAPMTEELKVHALHDFDPKQMSYRELVDLTDFLKSQGLLIETERNIFGETVTERMFCYMLGLTGVRPFEVPLGECEVLANNKYVFFEDDCKHNRNLKRLGLPVRYKQIIPWKIGLVSTEEDGSREKVDIKRSTSLRCGATVRYIKGAMLSIFKLAHIRTREETSDIKSKEEKIKTKWLNRVMRKTELMTDEEDLKNTNEFHASSDSDEEDRYALMVTFKRGDKMATVHPANICDTVGWWMVRNLDSGEIGFIPRHHVVIEHDQQTSNTSLNDIPLELLDIVLEKSFLHWIPQRRNEDVIKTLASVDYCCFQRITRRKFKNASWLRVKDFYGKHKKSNAINRNNQNYLLENIQPSGELIASLLSLNCITEAQSRYIQRRHTNRQKNYKLLDIMRSSDETKFQNFVRSFRKTNQKTVAWVMENGGVASKIEVHNHDANMVQMLHNKIEERRHRTRLSSHQRNEVISILKNARIQSIEILNSRLDRQTVVVWIWCYSQAGLRFINILHESNTLGKFMFAMANIPPSTSVLISSKVFNIDCNQFKKTIVNRRVSVDFTKTMDVGTHESLHGLTILKNEIYVLHETVIYVYEDRNPFPFKKTIEINKDIENPGDIGSSEKEYCLYVSDRKANCIWKITQETDDHHIITKWLTLDFKPRTLSMSPNGQLLVVSESSSILRIYGSDAELIRSIPLPREIVKPIHAVETSIGNFIILHSWEEKKKKVESPDTGRKSMEEEDKEDEEEEKRMEKQVEENGSSRNDSDKKEEKETKFGICEVSNDGKIVLRHFIPVKEIQFFFDPVHLTLDSDDRVFVAYHKHNKDLFIMLESDLTWNGIIRETNKDTNIETHEIQRVYYDDENKQLIVAGTSDVQEGVHIYTINRK